MSCTELVIRCANKQDMEAVGQLIIELAAYHKTPEIPKTTWRDLQRDGFEKESPAFRCIVAERKKENKLVIVGYAVYYHIYSSKAGRCMMLEDIFVQLDDRHRGIGNLLFNTVVKEAYSTGCGRVDFHVAGWNRARSWYEGKGAVNLTDREGLSYWRLSGAALRAAATEGSEEKNTLLRSNVLK